LHRTTGTYNNCQQNGERKFFKDELFDKKKIPISYSVESIINHSTHVCIEIRVKINHFLLRDTK